MKSLRNEKENSATLYEAFMKRALNTRQTLEPGVHSDNLRLLISYESGSPENFEKQLELIKNYLTNALTKCIQMEKLPEQNKLIIDVLLKSVPNLVSSDDVIDLVQAALDNTEAVKGF